MRVHLGSDHAGFKLKQAVVRRLGELGREPVDQGAGNEVPADDYPPYVLRAAQAVASEPGSLGVVIGGSGNGEAIAANKVKGVRCALAWSVETAQLGREHNDANVVSLGARMRDDVTALGIVETFLRTPYSGDPRHIRRIGMLTDYETPVCCRRRVSASCLVCEEIGRTGGLRRPTPSSGRGGVDRRDACVGLSVELLCARLIRQPSMNAREKLAMTPGLRDSSAHARSRW